jgi:hydroxymethylpyrimidine pyrophosphatase-like HAD family hydrolase
MLKATTCKEILRKNKVSEEEAKKVLELLKQLAEVAYSEYNKTKLNGRCSNLYESINRGTSK